MTAGQAELGFGRATCADIPLDCEQHPPGFLAAELFNAHDADGVVRAGLPCPRFDDLVACKSSGAEAVYDAGDRADDLGEDGRVREERMLSQDRGAGRHTPYSAQSAA